MYQIIVKDLSGNILGEFDKFDNLKFQKVLNREGNCSFTIPILDQKANNTLISLAQREVYIYKDTNLVWGGTMDNYQGSITGGDDNITINCSGFFKLLQKRISGADDIYTSVEQCGFVSDRINATQALTNGDFGITIGTVPSSGITRNIELQYQDLYTTITQLASENNGFDFELTSSKEFNMYFPTKGTDRTNTVVFNQVTFNEAVNVDKIDYTVDATNLVNEVIAIGSGYGSSMATATIDNASLQGSYKLRQATLSQKDLSDTSLLSDAATKRIALYGLPARQYNLAQIPNSTPKLGDVVVGDWVKINVDKGFIQLDDTVRINTISVDYTGGIEQITYTFYYG